MPWEVTTLPAAEPLTTTDARAFLNLTSNDDDDLLGLLIQSAREWVQKTTGRALLTQTIKEYWDWWPPEFGIDAALPGWTLSVSPASSVTSIQYVDTNGATQTWATSNYTVDVKSAIARIVPTDAVQYPALANVPNAVIATYVAGYSTVANVPATARTAMLQKIAYWYENREDIPVNGVGGKYRVRAADSLLFNERLYLV